ncbi:hypothetical protein CONCODRAFT_13645, partial [Conidiobolus coronatus NRRL 28638]
MKINKDHAPGQSLEGLIEDILDEYYVNNRPRQYADNTNNLENLGNNVALIAALNRPNIPMPMTGAIANYNVSSNGNEVGTLEDYVVEERKSNSQLSNLIQYNQEEYSDGISGQFRGSNKFSHHLTVYRPFKHKEYPSYDAEGKENVHSYLDRIFMIKGLNRDDHQRVLMELIINAKGIFREWIRKPNNKRLFTIARGFEKEMIKRFESYNPIDNLHNNNSLKMDRNKESVADYIDQMETLYSNFQFNPVLRIEEAISRARQYRSSLPNSRNINNSQTNNRTSQNISNNQNNKNNGACYTCGKFGHRSKECPNLNTYAAAMAQPADNINNLDGKLEEEAIRTITAALGKVGRLRKNQIEPYQTTNLTTDSNSEKIPELVTIKENESVQTSLNNTAQDTSNANTADLDVEMEDSKTTIQNTMYNSIKKATEAAKRAKRKDLLGEEGLSDIIKEIL